ncbi:translation initiation factor IF-2 [Cocleimonas sp. KMM 6892]|uniref:translation initiation factor IF-2 n=1 Tax=unclassified Cocleimonas TaxID=2639732 RepID=UPI002DBFEBDB|nr:MULTISPECIES: translation initiation factor IF-2 [unclassified Cocleimonas]MEB8433089.1 translation initiation factor IF-2 [Cocleimonas sp. KMM 6892]MEC4715930.1 translation initiation factor IF-2 [Cocleimonas sp. KMM 6895]MEC4745391.1 translation initiation factor IF-2 [Cocleimonas sp. KMM 6896]
MSDIIVKQLAELIGAPVESLLRQLNDAGISVSGAEDSITDAQKLKLLEFIRTGQATTTEAAPKKAGGKISLKRRSSSEINVSGAQGKTNVSVEVRRKKNFSRSATETSTESETSSADIDDLNASANRTNDLAEQLSNERKAREDAIDKSKAERQATSERKAEEKIERDTAKETAETTAEAPQEEVTETAVEPEVTTETVAEESTPTATEESAPAETPVAEKTEEAPAEVAPVKKKLELPTDPRERREFLAKRARDEAAAKFKKRPSRPKPVPKPAPAKPAAAPAPAPSPTANANKGKKKPFQGRGGTPGGQLHVKEGLSGRRKKKGKRTRSVKIEQSTEHGFVAPTEPVVRSIEIPETIVVSELAQMLSVKGGDVIRAMMDMGVMATINQVVDQDTAILIVEEMGHEAKAATSEEEKSSTENLLEDTSQYETFSRAPVVTIMGHVDHGKTSLLDYIRESRVASGEAGGITQHIGAYQVATANGIISFLDTPGHAAFTQMRARGAKATDIVILVVAADDGVMPQTEEAIKHTREAGVPLIVAINKIDKESADPERVKSELAKFEVVAEEWGGEDVFANVSAKTGEGIDGLLESILLVAEVRELKARKDGPAKGTIIESSVVKGRGAVATVLVQEGTLKKGDVVLAGSEFGRVRAMTDDLGKPITEAGPSTPIEILGLSGTPSAGDDLVVLKNERKARELATKRHEKERETRFAAQQAAKLDAMFEKMQDGEKSTLNVLLKADVQGSLEAIKSSLNALSTDEVVVNIISSGVGGLSETDISLAQSSEAVIIGFNVRADASARRFAQESDTEIRYYSIIYELIDDVRDAMSGLLKPELREELVGIAEVKDVFTGSGFGNIAGCLVIEGKIKKDLPIRVLRKDVVIYEGYLESLRRHQDDVKEVAMGTECGIGVKNYDDVQPGDQIEVFTRTEIERKLESS